jgi:hypothetical protein
MRTLAPWLVLIAGCTATYTATDGRQFMADGATSWEDVSMRAVHESARHDLPCESVQVRVIDTGHTAFYGPGDDLRKARRFDPR